MPNNEESMSEIPQLNELEIATLQNIMLRMTLERQRIEMCQNKLMQLDQQLNGWKREFNKKLEEVDLNIAEVEINAETGQVTKLAMLGEANAIGSH